MPHGGESGVAERFLPGQVVADRYRMVERVGSGGMGEVYRAEDLRLGEPVALKFLPPELSRDGARRAALLAEVRLARQVSHPNVCRVHDLEEMEGMQFLSMEFVDGEDLASLLRRIGRLPSDKAVQLAREICAGLSAVHERGLLHRDLKPANVMIDGRGDARLTDFGLAELQGARSDPETIVGTPDYMAPELLDGSRGPSVQSDLYGLGLVMYELFTGRRPFPAAGLADLIRLRCGTEPVRPSHHQRDLDPAIDRLILRCLERDPGRRPRSAREVAAALPGGDPLAAALAAGKTPSPELVAASVSGAEGLRPAVAWSCLAALMAGLLLLTSLSPRTRLVPSLRMPEPPDAMAGRARALLRDLGFRDRGVDRAHGYDFEEAAVERILERDRSPDRWKRLREARSPVVSFWYRESAAELVARGPWYRVTYADPSPTAPGMVAVKLDAFGRLRRLDAPPGSRASLAPGALDREALFRAAGLDPARFQPSGAAAALAAGADHRLVFEERDPGRRPGESVRVEMRSAGGLPVWFAVYEADDPGEGMPPPPTRGAALLLQSVRPGVFLAALFLGGWLARRNLRARRGDTKRAARLASALFVLHVMIWLLGGHHTPSSLTEQVTAALAWGILDFVYGWLFYVAIEPYVRRLWPRVLTSWTRLLDGRHADARVGRDLLVGCLLGTTIALSVAAHQAAPAWLGAPPGRPDNAGYVAHQLASLLGLRHQLAEIFTLFRSNLVIVMGFLVILVMARLTLRNAVAAIAVSVVVFLPLALPEGEIPALDLGFAAVWILFLFAVLMRFGMLAAGITLVTHAALQSAPIGMEMGSWPASRTLFVLLLVFGAGLYGFVRSLGGRPAIRDLLAAE